MLDNVTRPSSQTFLYNSVFAFSRSKDLLLYKLYDCCGSDMKIKAKLCLGYTRIVVFCCVVWKEHRVLPKTFSY